MTPTPRPNARCIIVCERVVADPKTPNRISLLGLLTSIRPSAGSQYPVGQDELCVFAQLTECRGAGRIRVEIRHSDTDEVTRRSPDQLVVAPNDPLAVRGITFRFRPCVFPKPGLYRVLLMYDDNILTETPIVLRPRTLPPPRGEHNGR